MGLTMLLEAREVTFGYSSKHQVLTDVSLAVERGEVVSLLGPNGCGKTTLLKLLLGILSPMSGEVLIDGAPIRKISPKQIARRIAYVPQIHDGSFPYQVMDVVLMGRIPHKSLFTKYSRLDREISESMLERLGIAHLKLKPYTAISGGERQLTLIARAMAQGADAFIMDEPTTGLDYGNQMRLLDRIGHLASEGYTVITSTHYPDHALWHESRVVILKAGALVADGPAAVLLSDDALSKLYGTPISVVQLAGGPRCCIPSDILLNKTRKQIDEHAV